MNSSNSVTTDKEISFKVRLTDDDWDADFARWRCSALRIPGVTVEKIYGDGSPLVEKSYDIDMSSGIIDLMPLVNKPDTLAVLLRTTEGLSTKTDREKWKRRAIYFPPLASVAGALLGAIATIMAAVTNSQPSAVATPPKSNLGTSISAPSTDHSQPTAPGNEAELPPNPVSSNSQTSSGSDENINPLSSESDEMISKEQALTLVSKWLEVKTKILSAPFDTEADERLLSEVAHTDGNLYRSLMSSDGKIERLKSANATIEYDYSRILQSWGPTTSDVDPKLVVKVEESFEYRSPRGVTPNKSDLPGIFDYEFKKEGNSWKISDYKERED
ncbi:MAG: IMS domain-containing protein [Cyanobacteria bacterium J06621_3]